MLHLAVLALGFLSNTPLSTMPMPPRFPLADFALPEEMLHASNLRVEPVPPDTWTTLIPADPAHPKMWTYPAAVEPLGDHVRVWYQRVDKAAPEYADQRVLCLGALTRGGFTVTPVREGAPAWGGVDNIVLRRSALKPTWGGFNVFQMTRMGAAYTLLYWDQPNAGDAGAMLATSPDGVSWSKDEARAVFTEHNDAYSLYHSAGLYLVYQTMLEDWPDKPFADNLDKKRRVIALRSSADLHAWSPQEVVLRPDAQDPPETEFYLMKVFLYQGHYFGLIMKYYADPARPNEHSAILKTELVVSTNGRDWERRWRDIDFGLWTYADPFRWEGRLAFIAGKDNATHLATTPALTAIVAHDEAHFDYEQTSGVAHLSADTRGGWIEFTPVNEKGEALAPAKRFSDTQLVDKSIDFSVPPSTTTISVRLQNTRLFSIIPLQESPENVLL